MSKPDSPALGLLAYVWKHEGSQGGKSWRRLNAAMHAALKLAIESLMEFEPDDFKAIYGRFNAGYWIGQGIEGYYSRAVDGPHGPNPSAIKALEKYLGRKPYIVATDCRDEKRIRLHVGARFDWHDGLKERVRCVEVTSFQPADGDKPAYVVACTYKRPEKADGGYEPRKVDRVFKITHADIAAYHKAIREHKKAWAEKQPAEASP